MIFKLMSSFSLFKDPVFEYPTLYPPMASAKYDDTQVLYSGHSLPKAGHLRCRRKTQSFHEKTSNSFKKNQCAIVNYFRICER